MSLYSRIPTKPVGDGSLCLHRVDFKTYAEKIACLDSTAHCNSLQEAADATTKPVSSLNGPCSGVSPLVRLVGFHEELNSLRMILGSSQNSNVWISGARGSGKTSLVEALIRLRAEKRLSSQMQSKPFFLMDVSAFFKLPRAKWVDVFNGSMEHVIAHKGMIIIDHFDDFVRMGGTEAGRLVNTLVSGLENFENTGAIVISESEHNEKIMEASTGIDRRFQILKLDGEKTDEELKTILISQFRLLERVHNVDFTEEAADEIIRLLGRYPGRAFPGVRPRNAVTFADRVATYVRLSKYAEPPEVADLREKVDMLTDRVAVLLPVTDEDKELHEQLDRELIETKEKYNQVDAAWKQRFKKLFEAQETLYAYEKEMRPLEERGANRNADEAKMYSMVKEALKAQRADIERLERELHPEPPRITAEHIRHIFSEESGISLSTLSTSYLERLAKLDEALDKEIFKQEKAKRALAEVYREREMGVSDPSRPAGVLMFTGGTGLGKTELIKAIARFDGGEAASPLIIRMSEFTGETADKKLLGADPGFAGYNEGSPFLDPIAENGRLFVLLDEADKANPKVYNVLMQALEEGVITNSKGKKIEFKDVILVLATNALKAEDFSADELDDPDAIRRKMAEVKSLDNGERLFTPEFLARVNSLIVFENLENDDVTKILKKEVAKTSKDFGPRGISMTIDEETAALMVEHLHVPSMNGRGPRNIMKAHVRPKIMKYLSERLLALASEGKQLKETVKINYDGKNVTLKKVEEVPARPAGSPDLNAKPQLIA